MRQRLDPRVHATLAALICLLFPGALLAEVVESPPALEALPEAAPSAPAEATPEPEPIADDFYAEDFDDEDFGANEPTSDPLEPANRAIFMFNMGLDRVLLNPLTRGYQFIVPQPVRHAVRRAFANLNSPSIFVNDLLQLRGRDAAVTLGRLLLNSTAGIGGLFDAAVEAGLEPHDADFGQTLASMGVGTGPYLVLPILGPSTARDGFGEVVDYMMQPMTYILGPARLLTITLPIGTGRGFALREEHAAELRALRESSVDFYAALRSAYLQNRRAKLALMMEQAAR